MDKVKYGLTEFPFFNVESEFFRLAYSTMVVTNELVIETNKDKISLYNENLRKLIDTMWSYHNHFNNIANYNDLEKEETYLKFIKRVQSFSNFIEEYKSNKNEDTIDEYYNRILDYYELLKVPVDYVKLKDED